MRKEHGGASLTFKRFSSCLAQSKMEANGSQWAGEGFPAERAVEGHLAVCCQEMAATAVGRGLGPRVALDGG